MTALRKAAPGAARIHEPAAPRIFVAEPPVRFAVRPPIVVDCSVLAAVLFDEPERDAALEHLRGRALHAPTLIGFELANVAVLKSRAGASDAADLALADFEAMDIELHGCPPGALTDLALRYRLTAYDAAYLLLASILRAPLATFDRKLGEAARKHLAGL